MKTKRLTATLLAAFFVIAILLSCVFIFSVQKIDVKFNAEADADTLEVQRDLEQFNNKNLIFFDLQEVEKVIAKYPYFKFSWYPFPLLFLDTIFTCVII